MPALKKVAPVILKEILEAAEWALLRRWPNELVFGEERRICGDSEAGPIGLISGDGECTDAGRIGSGDYFRLLAIVEEARRLRDLPPDGSEVRPVVN